MRIRDHMTLKNFAFGSLLGAGGMSILSTWNVSVPHGSEISSTLMTLVGISVVMLLSRILYVKGTHKNDE